MKKLAAIGVAAVVFLSGCATTKESLLNKHYVGHVDFDYPAEEFVNRYQKWKEYCGRSEQPDFSKSALDENRWMAMRSWGADKDGFLEISDLGGEASRLKIWDRSNAEWLLTYYQKNQANFRECWGIGINTLINGKLVKDKRT